VRPSRRGAIHAAAIGLCACLPAGALATPPVLSTAIVTGASPPLVRAGEATTIAGTLEPSVGPNAGVRLELQADDGDGGSFVNIAHTVTGAQGEYAFAATRPYRDTRYRVAYAGPPQEVGPAVEVRLLSVAYPSPPRVQAAGSYLARRSGVTAFAVVNSEGVLSGMNVHERFHSASVVKSMLLVAYLRKVADGHHRLSRAGRALLYPMIHESSNEAASAVLGIVGERDLNRVARDAHMVDYEPGGGAWGFTEVSAADLARFFYEQDSLIPPRYRSYARRLLSGIEPSESWGVPEVARPEFEVFFKGGWLPEVEGLVNQAARLEGRGIAFAMAVLTREDPSMEYGEETIEGVTARLLGRV
jgi:hypothetical protein